MKRYDYCEYGSGMFEHEDGAYYHADDVDTLLAKIETLTRELKRWRHGETIEGDYVCPNSLALTMAMEREDRLRAALEIGREFVADDLADKRSLWGDRMKTEQDLVQSYLAQIDDALAASPATTKEPS